MFLWTCTDKWDFLRDASLIQVKHLIKTSQSRAIIHNKADKQFISQIFSVMKTSFKPFLFTTRYKGT